MKVPFLDLATLHKPLKSEILSALADVIDSGEFILGSAVEAFEAEFAEFVGVSHAVSVNSGTSALHLCLLASGIGPGDEVITVPSTFVATISAIVYTGARPVFVDIDPNTWTLDSAMIRKVISSRTKAILPVHLHGQMADMKGIRAIADEYGLRVIEDACQAHGAYREDYKVGDLSDSAAFSFYPGKNLGAMGEGGAVVTNCSAIAARVRLLRNWGSRIRYQHEEHAFNYRMDGFQGAVLRVKLRHLASWTVARRQVAKWYDEALNSSLMDKPNVEEEGHSFHIYAVGIDNRDAILERLRSNGIDCAIHYPVPVHLQPAYGYLGTPIGELPVAERLAKRWLSLPMDPNMTKELVRTVSGELLDAIYLEGKK